jgi:sugar O-acyltransferase (sialic acid O-acetyltransferase NeuD family)
MKMPLILWGSTGQAIVLGEFLPKLGYEIVAVFDNNPNAQSLSPHIPIYYGFDGFEEWRSKHARQKIFALVAIGGDKGVDRLKIQQELEQRGLEMTIAIHPHAYVAEDALIQKGSQILVNATVCARVQLGKGTIINTSASVDHESRIGDGVHIGPGATLAGCVVVDDCSLVGAGAVILPRVHIGKHTIIGAGSVVTKNIPDHVIVYGNPAKIVRDHTQRV